MGSWQLQEAKQRFSELIRAVESDGAQVVTRRGEDVAVVVDVQTFQQMSWAPTDLKDYLTSGPDLDGLEIDRDTAPAAAIDPG